MASINTYVETAQVGLSGAAAVNTTTTYFDSTKVRMSFMHKANVTGGTNTSATLVPAHPVMLALPAARTDFWLALDVYPRTLDSGAGSALTIIQFLKSGVAYLRLVKLTATANWQFQTLISGTWTAIGSAVAAPSQGAKTRIDIHIVINGSTGSVAIYADSVEVVNTGSLNTKGDNPGTTIDAIRFGAFTSSTTANNETHWSAMWVSDEDTRGYLAQSVPLSGAGDNSAWSDSVYTNLNATGRDDTNSMHTTSAAQRSDFAQGGAGAGTDTIRAVNVFSRAAKNGSGPTQAAAYLRISSTNYDGSSQSIAAGVGPYEWSWETNPAGGAWTRAAFAAAKVGMLSVA